MYACISNVYVVHVIYCFMTNILTASSNIRRKRFPKISLRKEALLKNVPGDVDSYIKNGRRRYEIVWE